MKKYYFSDIYGVIQNKNYKYVKRIVNESLLFYSNKSFEFRNTNQTCLSAKDESNFIVSASNYMLQKDCMDFKQKKFNINILNEEKHLITPDIDELSKKHKSHILRNFLTFSNYNSLQNVNLSRIEHYLLLMYSNNLKFFEFEGLLLPKQECTLSFSKKRVLHPFFKKLKNNSISTIHFILFIAQIRKISTFKALDMLYKDFFLKLNITDPFIGEFKVLNDAFIFYKEFLLLQQMADKLKDKLLMGSIDENQPFFYVLKENSFSSQEIIAIKEYFNIMYSNISKPTCYIKKHQVKNKNIYAIYYFIMSNKYFIPVEDFFLSLYNLLKLEYIVLTPAGEIYTQKHIVKYLAFEDNLSYLSLKEITDIFNEFVRYEYIYELPLSFEEISTIKPRFLCPLCGSKLYEEEYEYLNCKNKDCNFIFNRGNLKKQNIKTVKKDDIFKGLAFKNIYLKNDKNQLKLFTLTNYKDHKYSFTLKNINS